MRQLSDDFYVSSQIDATALAEISAAGIQSLICNRPDHEEPGQPEWSTIEAAAHELGLKTACVPIDSMGMTADKLEAFHNALSELPRPILAYCRTGTRCTILWTISEFENLGADELLQRTSEAGYDMRGVVAQLGAQKG